MKQKFTKGVKESYNRQYARLLTKRYGNTGGTVRTIVVAGTNGKTTTAKYLHELLQEAGRTSSLLIVEGDDALGVKRTQQFLKSAKKESADYAILALPTADIKLHSLGAAPIETVVVTNSTEEDLAALKQLLALKPRYIVLNRDDPNYEELSGAKATAQLITYGQDEHSEAKIERMNLYRKGGEVLLVIDHQTKLRLATYLVGTANLYNLTAAVTVLYVMGEDIMSVDEGAARLEMQPTNYEYIVADVPYKIVLDYAPNSMALGSVVASAKQLAKRRLIVAIQADTISEEQIQTIASNVDRLVVVDVNDDKPTLTTLERVTSPDMAIKLALRAARQDDTVLLAGPVFARADEDGQTYAHVVIENSLEE